MAKGAGRLAKLRWALKRINSFGNKSPQLSRSNSTVSSTSTTTTTTVYVGMSKREYRVDPELLAHPAVQELLDTSDGQHHISVRCEVVLFDHLRWMIENSDSRIEPLDDLADFYAY